MKRYFKLLALTFTVLAIFAGCALNTKCNQQIKADSVLDRQIPGTQYSLFNYSFTNSNECIDTIYIFNVNPDTFAENDAEAYENNYLKKYSYLYLNGKSDSSIQVQRRIYNDLDDEIWYDYQCFYIRSSEHKNKLQAYHSYDIGTNGSVFEDDYFYYSYDENGLLTNTMDDTGYENCFYYDDQDILVSRTFDVTESDYDEKTYSYESEGGNIVTVYAHNAENGNTISRYEYEYDSDNRITKESVYSYYKNEEKRLGKSISYSYDNNGNISKIIDEQYNDDTDSYQTTLKSYFYNDNNNISRIVTDDGKSVKYTVFVYTNNPAEYNNEN